MWAQRVIAAALVLLCAAFLARRAWKAASSAARARDSGGCGPDCGCGVAATSKTTGDSK